MIGAHPKIGFTYAVSGDGVSKITCEGCPLAELFPFPSLEQSQARVAAIFEKRGRDESPQAAYQIGDAARAEEKMAQAPPLCQDVPLPSSGLPTPG